MYVMYVCCQTCFGYVCVYVYMYILTYIGRSESIFLCREVYMNMCVYMYIHVYIT